VKINANDPMTNAFNISSITTDFFLSNQSPKTPAKGENISLGIMSIDRIEAKTVADPVRSRTYRDKANCNILLPNSDTNLPHISKAKSFCLISFAFIKLPPFNS
jgi:hypothetical protein